MRQSQRGCILADISDCRGGLSQEHYISESVLELIFPDGNGVVTGTPWSSHSFQQVSINSLTAKILCEGHNNALSYLDSTAKNFFSALQRAQLSLAEGGGASFQTNIDGIALERWLLKVAVGMLASGNLAHQGQALPRQVPGAWQQILIGDQFPEQWGLYIRPPVGEFVTAVEFEVVPQSGPDLVPKVFHFGLARLPFSLLLGVPDVPEQWGFYRPAAIVLLDAIASHKVVLNWGSTYAGLSIEYTRLRDAH